jgi:hypothetical protein
MKKKSSCERRYSVGKAQKNNRGGRKVKSDSLKA